MYVDWITWGIWMMGFAILVVWMVIPYREFRELISRRRAVQTAAEAQRSSHTISES